MKGVAVAVHSALRNLAPAFRPRVFVLDNGLSPDSRTRLLRMVDELGRADDLVCVPVPYEALVGLPSNDTYTPTVYARLLIPEIVPASIQRVVYLDSDLLVRRDLGPLFEAHLCGALVGAVRDYAISNTAHPLSGVRERDMAPRPYFNSGVLVIDLAGWRRSDLAGQALAYIARDPQSLPLVDQDALNAVVDRWHALGDEWNVQPMNLSLAKRRLITDRDGYARDRRLFRNAAIVHFVGPKPWWPLCEARGTTAWVRRLLRTGWMTRAEAFAWLIRWSCVRAMRWPGIAARRWSDRFVAIRGAIRAQGP